MERPDRLPRKLAAILYADVAGYSRLTGKDEDTTHLRLREYLDLIADQVVRHGGHVMHYAGDAVLAMFDAVADALLCAAQIQRSLEIHNDIPDEQKVQFRIGVNLGDVIEDRGDIYGDGVNVAARLESLAEPGGICVSGTVYDAVGTRLPLDYESMGEQQVKNIEQPVRAYQVRLKAGVQLPKPAGVAKPKKASRTPLAIAVTATLLVVAGGLLAWLQPWQPRVDAASVERMAFPLPDKPSIAVLPFSNMSDYPKQEYFVDGMTEDLITDLSKISGLFVIARNSSFTYKGTAVDVKQVSRELGVKYVLEGSVRRAADQVRINAQLIDGTTGGHLWAERYDGSLDDIFALQDQVTQKIVAALAISLEADEQALHDTDNAQAHDAYLQGSAYYRLQTPEDFARAIPYFEEAITLDSNYARAHAALASLYWDAIENDWAFDLNMPSSRAESRANEHLEEALKMPTPLAYILQSRIFSSLGFPNEALEEAEKAVALDPNDATALAGFAYMLVLAGRPDEGLTFIQNAMRLDPHHARYLITLGAAEFGMERFKEAAATFERAVKRNPDNELPLIYLAASYGHLGRIKDADEIVEAANQLLARQGKGELNLEKQLSHHFGEIDFPRFGVKSAQERIRAGLIEIPALTWQSLVTAPLVAGNTRWTVEGATEIDVATAKSLHDKGVVFIDTSTEDVWKEGHIPGAFNLRSDRDNEDPTRERFKEAMLKEIVGKTEEVVLYKCSLTRCWTPAPNAAKAVTWGYKKVFHFSGGTKAWKEAGHKIEKDE
jgi:TolB-like protein/class 3 adenylate cyclase/Flp pilus assembly protein TadD/rhodanese-related sulfurtransferase